MTWDEFRSLLAGLSPDTALGRVVAIRAEKDEKVIRHFTKDQQRIYAEWRDRSAKEMSQSAFEKEMDGLEKMFASMYG